MNILTFVKRLPVGAPPEALDVDSSVDTKLSSQSEDILFTSSQNESSRDEQQEKRHKISATVQRKHASFREPLTRRQLSVGYTQESQQILGKPGNSRSINHA